MGNGIKRIITPALAGCLMGVLCGNPINTAGTRDESPRSNKAASFAKSTSQELQHFVTVINIEVPVRVFKGSTFVDDLTINDFEVFEDGKPQKIEAVYLIKKTSIKKEERPGVQNEGGPPQAKIKPDVKKRHFVLIFEMDDYLPKINDVLDYFFTQVLAPDDTVWVFMPDDSIRLKKDVLTKMPRVELAEQLKTHLKKAIRLRTWRLNRLIDDLNDLAKSGTDSMVAGLSANNIASEIAGMKMLTESQVSGFAAALKAVEGQKNVFLFYQKEAYRIPSGFRSVLEEYSRKDYIDAEKIQRAFADASTSVHFLFVTKPRATFQNDASYQNPGESEIFEQGGGDFYTAFREMAVTTGGITETSANPAFLFQKAVEASENYYLLYYQPADYKADGRFKEIEVKIRSGSYRVSHRAGYIEK